MEFVNGTDPNEIMYGQVWEKLPGGYHLLSTDNNDTSMEYDDASNHTPGTTFKGGLPNIRGETGTILYRSINNRGDVFSAIDAGEVTIGPGLGSSLTGKVARLQFNANRVSGSRYGVYQGNSNNTNRVIGDHIAAVMWKRVR